MVQSQGPTLNNCKVIHPWSLTGSSALPRKETRTRLQKSCFRGELVIVQGVNTWLEGLAGYTESMFPRHPGTINTFWRVKWVFDPCMRWSFCCHTEPQFRKTWMTGITTGWVQLWGGPHFSRWRVDIILSPNLVPQRTGPSPFLLSSHAWNHQNLDLKPPVFFRQHKMPRCKVAIIDSQHRMH